MSGEADLPPLRASDALFLDFDGTLAPIVGDRNAVFLDSQTTAALHAAAEALGGAVAVISGRDLRDLADRVPAGVHRIGAHGLEAAGPNADPSGHPQSAPRALVDRLEALAGQIDGVEVELKGPVIAVHYRKAPDLKETVESEVAAAAAAVRGYVVQSGKCVVEVKPGAANKGRTLRNWLSRPPFAGRRPVMVGDDATDEDAFKVVIELGGVAIKVGEGGTVAPYRLADTRAVARWLLALEPA
jgi:trehalose 6-phosphate phosphatase